MTESKLGIYIPTGECAHCVALGLGPLRYADAEEVSA